MPVASPAILVAAAPSIRFDFPQSRQKVRVQVRFFSDAEATAGNEIAKGLGSRVFTVSTHDSISTPDGTDPAYANASLESNYVNGTRTIVGGTWDEFEYSDGARNATVVCAPAAPVDDAAALAYRVFMSVVGAKVTVI